jgi:hypothetical protein
MNFFSMILFNKLFSIYNECSGKYDEDSNEYRKCKQIQSFNNQLLEEFLKDNKILLEQYIKMLEDFENKDFILQMYSIQKKIDEEIEKYISPKEEMEFLIEYLDLNNLLIHSQIDR